MPGNREKTDWINFINRFVIDFGKELIDIVHKYGKKHMYSMMTAGLV